MSLVPSSKKQWDSSFVGTLQGSTAEKGTALQGAFSCLSSQCRGMSTFLHRTCHIFSACHLCEHALEKDTMFALAFYRTWSAHWPFFCLSPTVVLQKRKFKNPLFRLLEKDGFPPSHLRAPSHLVSKRLDVQRSLPDLSLCLLTSLTLPRPPHHPIWLPFSYKAQAL
jgi:hypothetical protein